MSVISCIVQLGYNIPATEGSKYFELEWQPHKFFLTQKTYLAIDP